ncbi:MAG: IclR family transcriptional regulator [Betaproteobacteria bacterium]|nr:MAG: IclR family transcriptional regulator [Betaproteobacteria bacterium]
MRDSSTAGPARASDDAAPALRRGIALLRELALAPDGRNAAELAERLAVPRATLYRLLRTLVEERLVAPSAAPGRFVLGPAVAQLAAAAGGRRDLEGVARPLMEALAGEIGETVKLVVRDGREALTVAVAIPRDACIASRLGTRLPLYVGASQRLLLAHAPPEVRDDVLAAPLERITPRTITSPARLRRELETLAKRRDLASHGEGIDGVGATAALVGAGGAEPVAALVAVYVYASQTARTLSRIRRRVLATAATITRAL